MQDDGVATDPAAWRMAGQAAGTSVGEARMQAAGSAAFRAGAALAHLHDVAMAQIEAVPLLLLRDRMALGAAEASILRFGGRARVAELRNRMRFLHPGDRMDGERQVRSLAPAAVASLRAMRCRFCFVKPGMEPKARAGRTRSRPGGERVRGGTRLQRRRTSLAGIWPGRYLGADAPHAETALIPGDAALSRRARHRGPRSRRRFDPKPRHDCFRATRSSADRFGKWPSEHSGSPIDRRTGSR